MARKGSGWHKESERHSKARRGIRTVEKDVGKKFVASGRFGQSMAVREAIFLRESYEDFLVGNIDVGELRYRVNGFERKLVNRGIDEDVERDANYLFEFLGRDLYDGLSLEKTIDGLSRINIFIDKWSVFGSEGLLDWVEKGLDYGIDKLSNDNMKSRGILDYFETTSEALSKSKAHKSNIESLRKSAEEYSRGYKQSARETFAGNIREAESSSPAYMLGYSDALDKKGYDNIYQKEMFKLEKQVGE